MRGLYAIVDVATLAPRRVDPVAFAGAILEAGPAALQLRAKELSSFDTLALLRQLAPMCHSASVPLVANDRPDLALLAGCDMVHVGQEDMPVARARQIAPGLGIGVSTHTPAQLEAALASRPDYVAYGPVYATTSKASPDPVVGVEGVVAAHARLAAAGVSLVAIGGITLERARSLAGHVDAVAVIAGLLPAMVIGNRSVDGKDWLREVTARAEAFRETIAPTSAAVGASR
jgi:thiamine-phosphate pyrophosphorylase